jgi:2,3,4,5-tetrahydropyridine-2,6-dicarboxylate N-succinyltransferase/diaminopimelate decarboxylase
LAERKELPIPEGFARKLLSMLPDIVCAYGTPFHIYDARGIIETHHGMVRAFRSEPFRQHFAVKALPNPNILRLLLAVGSGLDCASPVELELAERCGAAGDDVVFTSNNTAVEEYELALKAGALITFDDRSFPGKVGTLPDIVSFRIQPDSPPGRSALMGDAAGTKFGVPAGQLPGAYREARRRGVTRFGIHGMNCANELDLDRATRAAVQVIETGARVAEAAGIELEYINLGGGLGVPYRPADQPFDFAAYADAILQARRRCFPRGRPRILTECGRYVTGPHGVLVTTVINRSRKTREIAGLDASMSALMRPGFYGAYHHLTLPFAARRPEIPVDVVGALCENMDKFAVGRLLPDPREGDIAIIHDTGAHGHAMGFTYNGRLRPAELLLTPDGDVTEIRRPETTEDYLSTVRWQPRPVLAAPADRGARRAAGTGLSSSGARTRIERAFERRDWLTEAELAELTPDIESGLTALDRGDLRAASPADGDWVVDTYVKKLILLSFLTHRNAVADAGPGRPKTYDRVPLKFEDWQEPDFARARIRAVPGAVVRYGAYVAPGAVLMPSFINVGAFVGADTMIDTWATVGSCAQVGERCHISGGAGLGGVLEPIGDGPVIIEDGVFVGARSEIAEGVRVRRGAVIGMGVYLGRSTPILDRATGETRSGEVPENAVVVAGARADPRRPGLSTYSAVIVKYADERTRAKTALTDLVRD